MYNIKGLYAKYSEKEDTILEDLSFSINKNSCIGIVGGNGSGKTTLAYSIIGIIPYYLSGIIRGQFHYNSKGKNLFKENLDKRLQWISYVFQDVESQILFGTVADILGLNEDKTQKDLTYHLLDIFRAKHLIHRNPSQLSTGETQKIALISAIKNNPQLVLYDEATSALDPIMKSEFSTIIKCLLDSDKTIILFGQKLKSLNSYCESVYALENKKIVAASRPIYNQKNSDFSLLFNHVSNSTKIRSFNISRLFHKYKGNRDFSLDINNLQFNQGEIIAIIGANGSGKTTFINALNGFLKPNKLEVSLDSVNKHSLNQNIFTVFNSPSIQITEATIGQELGFFHENDKGLLEKVLNHFPFLSANKDPFELSFGQQRILCMITAMLSRKPIVIFDEPELGIDENNIVLFKEFIQWNIVNRKKVIVFITHDLELAKNYSERLIVFHNGQISVDAKTDSFSNLDICFDEKEITQ